MGHQSVTEEPKSAGGDYEGKWAWKRPLWATAANQWAAILMKVLCAGGDFDSMGTAINSHLTCLRDIFKQTGMTGSQGVKNSCPLMK